MNVKNPYPISKLWLVVTLKSCFYSVINIKQLYPPLMLFFHHFTGWVYERIFTYHVRNAEYSWGYPSDQWGMSQVILSKQKLFYLVWIWNCDPQTWINIPRHGNHNCYQWTHQDTTGAAWGVYRNPCRKGIRVVP